MTIRYLVTDLDSHFGETLLRTFDECVELYADERCRGFQFYEWNEDRGQTIPVTEEVIAAYETGEDAPCQFITDHRQHGTYHHGAGI